MPVPNPLGRVFKAVKDAEDSREQAAKGAEVAAQESEAWTTFGDELADLVSTLESDWLGRRDPLGGLTTLPQFESRGLTGFAPEVPRHGVNAEEFIGHLTALMRDARALGSAYAAAARRLTAAAANTDA